MARDRVISLDKDRCSPHCDAWILAVAEARLDCNSITVLQSARKDDNMRRRDLCAALGSAMAALLFPAGMQAKEETITLEVTGMS